MRFLVRFLIGTLKLFGFLALLFGAYVGWSVYREREASSGAKAFCARFPVGSAMADAAAAARDEGERMLRSYDEKEVRAIFLAPGTAITLAARKMSYNDED